MAAEKKYPRKKPRKDAPITLNTWQLIADEYKTASKQVQESTFGKVINHLAQMALATNKAASMIEYPDDMPLEHKFVLLSDEVNAALEQQEQTWGDVSAAHQRALRQDKDNLYTATYGWYRKSVQNSNNRGTEPTVPKGVQKSPRLLRDQDYSQRECVKDADSAQDIEAWMNQEK